MDVIYVLIPMVLLFGFLVVIAFIWMAKKGFFEDLDGQGSRILMDDEDYPSHEKTHRPAHSSSKESQPSEVLTSHKDSK